MNGFVDLHGESITGVIETFDRVIFKGHLNGFFPDGAFGRYLSRRGILLKDAGRFFEAETQRIRDHVVSLERPPLRATRHDPGSAASRSEEHTSELQSQSNLVCRLLLEKKNKIT